MREAIPPWRAPAAVCALAAAGCRGTGRKCVGKALETVRRKATGLQRESIVLRSPGRRSKSPETTRRKATGLWRQQTLCQPGRDFANHRKRWDAKLNGG